MRLSEDAVTTNPVRPVYSNAQSVQFETEGMWPIGKVLVTCGHYELCLEDKPVAKTIRIKEDILPAIPKLQKNQRAILAVDANGVPSWMVQNVTAKTAVMASSWLAIIIAVIFSVKRLIKKWKEEE